MESSIQAFLQAISIPWVGLSSVGVMAFLAATLIPVSSEAVFYLYLQKFPENLWILIFVASLGNTLGGILNWYLGFLAKKASQTLAKTKEIGVFSQNLRKLGPKSLLFSRIPIIGDPLTIYAGWAQYSFVSCCVYMAIGKTLRYLFIAYIFSLANKLPIF